MSAAPAAATPGRAMPLTWPAFLVFLFFYRSVLGLLAETVVRQFTSLGDAHKYQYGDLSYASSAGGGSTAVTVYIGYIFNKLSFGNAYLTNVWFQAMAFVGIASFLTALKGRDRRLIALLCLTPSFNLWSSVASKEAVLVFCVGLIAAMVARMANGTFKPMLWHLPAIALTGYYKPQFMPAIVFLLATYLLAPYLRQRTAMILLGSLVSLLALYFVADEVDRMAFDVIPHFRETGGSTRPMFWDHEYDVFYKAPLGMYLSFVGPTIEEAFSGHAMLAFAFAESAVILAIALYLLLSRLPRLPLFNLFVFVFGMFWLLFPNYPVGVMNPGSAVRYRTGYILIFFLLFTVVLAREPIVRWVRQGRQRPSTAPPE